jgi:hypothetical protein
MRTLSLILGLWLLAGSLTARAAECTPVIVESDIPHSRPTVVRTPDTCIRYIPQFVTDGSDATRDVLVFGDPQPKSAVEAGYFRRDIVEPLRGRQQATLGMSLGDIVDDAPALYRGCTCLATTISMRMRLAMLTHCAASIVRLAQIHTHVKPRWRRSSR